MSGSGAEIEVRNVTLSGADGLKVEDSSLCPE